MKSMMCMIGSWRELIQKQKKTSSTSEMFSAGLVSIINIQILFFYLDYIFWCNDEKMLAERVHFHLYISWKDLSKIHFMNK